MNYRFSKKAIRNDAPNLSGVYLIYRSGAGMSHLDIYVGQTENILGSLLEHYEKKSDESTCIWKHAPTHFTYEIVWWEQARLKREQQWIGKYTPICN